MKKTIRFNAIRKTGLFFFMVLALFAFIAKGAVNIAFAAVMLMAVLDLTLNGSFRDLSRNRYFLAFFLPLVLGLALSLFSDAGLKGPGFIFIRYRFFFLSLPFFLFIREKKHILFLFTCLSLSGVASASYGFVMAEMANSPSGFNGLLIIGRNSDLLASLCLMNTVLLFELYLEEKPYNIATIAWLAIVLGICVAAILVIQQRGAILGLFLGGCVYGAFFNKKFLLGMIVATLIGTFVLKDDHPLADRIKSIGDTNDVSNAIRLDLLGSGIPYVLEHHLLTGSGEKKPEEGFTEFFKAKAKPFQERYANAMKHPGNFHNSFLQMAAEGGVLFLLAYLAGLGYIVARLVGDRGDPENRTFCIGALVVMIAGCVTFFFHGELFRYGGLVFCLALFSGCVRKTPVEPVPAGADTIPARPAVYGSQGPIAPEA